MNFSLRGLRYFVTTAEEGSVTAAARRLYVSQPSVSAAISHLEESIGQQLFVRKRSSGVILTPVGQHLLPEARMLLAHAEEFQTIANALDAELSGRLRMACFINMAPAYFASLLAGFQHRYPDVRVEFDEGDQAEILEGVRDARYELALTFDLCELDEFEITWLAEISPHVVLAQDHPMARQQRVSLREIAPEPLILMDMPHSRDYLLSLFRSLGIKPNLRYLPNSFEMVRSLTGNGLGYGLLGLVPKTSMTYDGTIVCTLPVEEKVQPLRIAAIQLPQMPTRRVARAFIDYMREYFAATLPASPEGRSQ
ncbi:LysR family transcriptional regulator [Billgrantia endophytica]|uniref:LysR family transcriptional regulator n=1 Tax=Billgrantia endophytica TaxID=2033802 RepID=A0A2N7TX49_9GAMM|nr:LysR family transcriptional regulator [Halomonas endophytica]PMR72751.1 LysR family transcriptional regulator [Halomonas endophytica]